MTDLIQGEFMQLGAKETENERFAHYLTKTYRKTASLIANGLKAVRVVQTRLKAGTCTDLSRNKDRDVNLHLAGSDVGRSRSKTIRNRLRVRKKRWYRIPISRRSIRLHIIIGRDGQTDGG